MAFRAPTPLPQRQHLSIAAQPSVQTQISQYQSPLEDSQEWVLFSPSQAPSTTRTQTTSTCTAGLSRVSEFGSLETAARSGEDEELGEEALDDEELDSLDDGLHAFREPSVYRTSSNRLDQSGGTVLPTHDGLGTFPASSPPVQEHLFQFEQYNPKRKFEGHHTRRSSVQRRLDAVEDRDIYGVEDDRHLRIEQWRMEQSRALLDEIEKETRRRRSSRASDRMGSMRQSMVDTMSIVMEDQPMQEPSPPPPDSDADESFLQRITRRVIRDLIGIDENTLSAIFGESVIDEPPTPPTHLPSSSFSFSTTPTQTNLISSTLSWQDRLLERIARELGVLVNQLAEHPGAFTSYLESVPDIPPQSLSSSPTDTYAGIPVTRSSTPRPPYINTTPVDRVDTTASNNPLVSPTSNILFSPTLAHHHRQPTTSSTSSSHAALWGIEEDSTSPYNNPQPSSPTHPLDVDDLSYWERSIDLKTLFLFLRNRFRRSRTYSNSNFHPQSSTSPPQPEAARRAAIIRAHHPLVARAHATNTQTATTIPTNPLVGLRRQPSSCASQSAKISTKRGSLTLSGSSRNYWDIGGSVGSDRGIPGGVGAWGEA
jgi:hypothetical protein